MSDIDEFFESLTPAFDPEQIKAQRDQQAQKHERLDNLIHRTFRQSESGRELLQEWTQALIMSPTAKPGSDMVDIGIEEGKKAFIRGILLTVERVENE